ncbi:hypothetical protein ACHAPT_007638 [Fusarium lateritium]
MPEFGGALDTPRTNIGDATYLSRQPDFADISQEASFQSPAKEGNLLQQLRNGRSNGINLRTPRQRGPLADRRNLPPSVGGAEFTPLLKSATRNSVRRFGKENGNAVPNTPSLDKIDEGDLTAVPRGDTSMYTGSRNQSYMENTMPEIDTTSAASTPLAIPRRRGGDKGPLQDGNQLSLREQENVIDRIEKENFGLKLKIHFLEEALRKAGPGFSEAALKENTELKVDKVTMQRELHRYKKHLTTAEKDLESYRQQMLELQDKTKRKYADQSQQAEMDKLRQLIEDREADIEDLQRQLDQQQGGNDQVEKLQDDIGDLEADLQEKDRLLTEREDEVEDLKEKMENLKDQVEDAEEKAKAAQRKMLAVEQKSQHNEELEEAKETIRDLEQNIHRLEAQIEDADAKAKVSQRKMLALEEKAQHSDELEDARQTIQDLEQNIHRLETQVEDANTKAKASQRKVLALEENAQHNDELEDAKETIQDLEQNIHRLEEQVEDAKAKMEDALSEKERAENDLDELQEEMANKSVVTKGLSRQIEEKVIRLQEDLDRSGQEYAALEKEYTKTIQEKESLQATVKELKKSNDKFDRERNSLSVKIEQLEADLDTQSDENNLLQSRYDTLTSESKSLQREVNKLQKDLQGLEEDLAEEREHALEIEKSIRKQYKVEMDRLNDEISDLQAEIRERDNLYDNDSEKWETEKQSLESERDRAEQKAAGLQRTIDRLQEAEGTLSDKESKLQAAIQSEADRHRNDEKVLARQIEDLQDALETRQTLLTNLRNELSTVRDELRQSQMDCQTQTRRASGLEGDIKSAVGEKDRLSQEILELQSKLRQSSSSESSDLAAARRTIRELERRVEDYEHQLNAQVPANAEGNGELSMMRKDLSAARRKENELLQKDSSHREIVKGLERQIADLEQQLHEVEVADRKGLSAVRQKELELLEKESASRDVIRGLERQLTDLERQVHETQVSDRKDISAARQKELELLEKESAHRDVVRGLERQIADLEWQVRETEVVDRKAMQSSQHLQRQLEDVQEQKAMLEAALKDARKQAEEIVAQHQLDLDELKHQLADAEDQKFVLEEFLEDAGQQAQETATQHERALLELKHQISKVERERNAAAAQQTDSLLNKQDRQVRKIKAEMENLEHDVRQQQELIDNLVASEGSLRRKLERARSERAAFRMSAEKLQKDLERIKATAVAAKAEASERRRSIDQKTQETINGADQALETVIRAAESAEERHKKELRGAVMQMEWMQARFKREKSLRADAAFAKKFLQLQLDIANACNKAQLRELEDIRINLLGNKKALSLPSQAASSTSTTKPSLRTFLVMARFIARARLAARNWAKQETVRRKLVAAKEEQRKVKRSHQLKVVRAEA